MTERIDIGDWCTLYHADATDILDVLREHEPAAVIMDPPYGIGYAHVGGRNVVAKFAGVAVAGDETGATLDSWFSLAEQCLLWGADHLREQLPAGGRFVAWDKLEGRESFDDFSDIEFGWHSRRGRGTFVSHRWKGFDRGRDLEEPLVPSRHPMQKPIRVMQWCIRECRLEPGATILDPYMGSGTTGIAAFGMDMKFVGVEIERRWFDAAVERIIDRCDEGLFASQVTIESDKEEASGQLKQLEGELEPRG